MLPTLTGLAILLVMILIFLKLLENFLLSCIKISQTPWGWSLFFGITGGVAALVGWLNGNTELTLYSLGAAFFLPVCVGLQRLTAFYISKARRARKEQERALYQRQFFGHIKHS